MFAWVVMPVAELFLSPDKKNLSAVEEELAKKDRLYDYLLYAIVILQFVALFIFLNSMKAKDLLW